MPTTTTTLDTLRRLQSQAAVEHERLRTRATTTATRSTTANAAIAAAALMTAISAATGATAASIALAVLLFGLTALKLALSRPAAEAHIAQLAKTWEAHELNAALLVRQHETALRQPAETAEIEQRTAELEKQIRSTRTESDGPRTRS